MIISAKWLRDYVDMPLAQVEDLANRLTMAGLEVEAIRKARPALEGVITAHLDKVVAHPLADRLTLCTVSAGGHSYRVVCGASNVREGAIVALALPGSQLPGGLSIREAQIRGELSQGMLCSQKELGLGDDEGGIWLLSAATPVGVPLDKALGIDDIIIDVGITPNRGDCLSVVGIAREVAAIRNMTLNYPAISLKDSDPPIGTMSSVTIDDPIGCPRYAARLIEGISVGPSPLWLCERLESVGLRAINNIVDVTNFILMDMGQPLHAFDFDRLREHRIVVRRAKAGEKFVTLDGTERSLFDDTLLICDGVGPVAVAGIMGGLNSEIVPETKRVLIESAYFDPLSIRRTGKKLGLRTESSYRFERGVDPEALIRALDRAAQLMQELAGGEIAGGRIDVYPNPIKTPRLALRVGRTNRFLGTHLTAEEMAEALEKIEMKVEVLEPDELAVVPPPFRPDISREVDLTEEIARLVGYDKIPVTTPKAVVSPAEFDPHQKSRQELKGRLVAAGFFEVITYSFISRDSLQKLRLPPGDMRLDPVAIRNPLSEDLAVMRTSLVPGILQAARYNLDRRNEDLKIFELSKVFLPRKGETLPDEPHHLAGIVFGKRFPNLLYGSDADADYTDVKGTVEDVLDHFLIRGVKFEASDLPPYLHPVYAASIFHEGDRVGAVGRLHPEVEDVFDFKKPTYLFELDFDRLYAKLRPRRLFQGLPRFPAVMRDMALVVDESVSVQNPFDYISNQEVPFLEDVEIFDIYRNPQLGQDKKSIGYRLVYRASDRSLTDEEVNEVHNSLVAGVMGQFNATLR